MVTREGRMGWRETTMIRFKEAGECRKHYDIDVGISGVIFHQAAFILYFLLAFSR